MRVVMGFAIAAIASDVLIMALAWADWHSFRAAPNNEFLQPADDFGFVLAALAFTVGSLLRYLALVGLIVALVFCRTGQPPKQDWAPFTGRTRVVVAAGVVLIETLYVAAVWTRTGPDGAWFVLRVVTCAMNAVLAALVLRLSVSRATAKGACERHDLVI